MRAVITVVGKDTVGILAKVSGVCAKYYRGFTDYYGRYVLYDYDGRHIIKHC